MKTKLLIVLSMFITSQAFAVRYCNIKGTSATVGIFPGDSTMRMSIYVKGSGYYPVTKADYAKDVFISKERNRDPVILDFKNKTLQIDNEVYKLVKCVETGSE